MATPLIAGPEIFTFILVVLVYVVLAVLAVRIALLFIEYPESKETRNRIALLEHEVAELQERIEELESE